MDQVVRMMLDVIPYNHLLPMLLVALVWAEEVAGRTGLAPNPASEKAFDAIMLAGIIASIAMIASIVWLTYGMQTAFEFREEVGVSGLSALTIAALARGTIGRAART